MPTENILVLERSDGAFIVKEGNRRVAALKLAYGLVSYRELPDNIKKTMEGLTESWKTSNRTVPCLVYTPKQEELVDKIVTRIHGKGEMAARRKWNAVASARHDREHNKNFTPGLDLLEKYLQNNDNLTPQQVEEWAGDYPLTILDEAIQKLYKSLALGSVKELIDLYPKGNKEVLDRILYDIGMGAFQFSDLRKDNPFSEKYGIARSDAKKGKGSAKTSSANTASKGKSATAVSLHDPKSVYNKLKKFKVKSGRAKVAALHEEILRLKIDKHRYSYVFLLRALFELSAKEYCSEHEKQIVEVEKNGNDRKLVAILGDIVKHIVDAENDDAEKMVLRKILHGAKVELDKQSGILSVTSMNSLIHSRISSISTDDFCAIFHNIFPLLEAMNK